MFDITEQKRAEQRLRQLVEELPVVTYLANEQDPDGNHVLPYVAPKIEELTGIPASEWMARPETWAELVHPDDRERVQEENRRTERTGERFEIEYRFLRRDGSIVWVRDTAVMVERDGDWPVWQGVIEDVTARHEAEARQREAETRYRHLVERLPAAVYIDAVDEMATAIYISPQYEAAHRLLPRGSAGRTRPVAADAAPRRSRCRGRGVEPHERQPASRSIWSIGSSPRTGERSGSTITRPSSTT